MRSNKPEIKSIDDYIATFPKSTGEILIELRKTIKAAAPQAMEKISYQMPAFFQNRNLVYFAAYKNHIGFYPGAKAIEAFAGELKNYKTSKGTVQFPLDKPIPSRLIKKIVKFKVAEI